MKIVLAVLFLSVAAFSQTMPQCTANHSNAPCVVLPDSPRVKDAPPGDHSFFDTENVSIFIGSATAISAEASMSCSQPPPVGLSLKTCNQLAAGGALFLTGQVLGAAVLHKTGHHTLERTVTPAVILFHVGRMVWISTHRGR